MKRLILLLALGLVACSDKASSPAALSSFSVSQSCTFVQTIAHDFLNWPSAVADEYDCALYPKMACKYYESASEKELTCVGLDPLDPSYAPSVCEISGIGGHAFLDGIVREDVTGYRCGKLWINEPDYFCAFSRAQTGHEELRCYRH